MNSKFGFVILHYGAMDVTIQCIQYIVDFYKNGIEIVIVDNASPDGSGNLLLDRYKDVANIHVLLNDKNLGFANGNNVGYIFARNELHCDMICVMNNDVFLTQSDFIERIEEEYKQSYFAVLGPHVTLKDGSENHPVFELKSLEFYREEYERIKVWHQYYSSNFFVIRNSINYIYDKVAGLFRKKQIPESFDEGVFRIRHEDVVLHGCCLIFSPIYVKAFEECFDTRTFLFREEELLYLRCKEKGMLTVYSPDLDVKHLEDVSTNSVVRTNRQKEIFLTENQMKSLRVLISTMEKIL